jgi:glycosyltransferase involved in cell wall biosynthesis
MPAIYDAHDVWLNASDVDNMPISILEAFASGVAVVTTDSGGIPYMVANGRNGLLVKQNDHEMLAQQAMAVIRDPQLHAELTRNGLRECAKYTWESIRGSWITAYSEMARLKGSQG